MTVSNNLRAICKSSLWPNFGYRTSLAIFVESSSFGRPSPQLEYKSRSFTTVVSTTVDTLSSSQPSEAESIVNVSKFLGLGLGKTKSVFKKLPDYATTPVSTLKERHGRLVEKGVSEERLKKLPHLLLQDPDKLDQVVSKVAKVFNISVKTAYAFAHLGELESEIIKKTWASDKSILQKCGYPKKYRNRLHFLRDRLKCTETEAADMLQAANLYSVPLERLCSTTELLLEAGVDEDHIRNDPWIFCLSNLEKVKNRLSTLQSNHVHPIKPWMLRADSNEFKLYVQNDVEEQNLMRGKANLAEFLASALHCSLTDAESLIRRESGLKLLKVRTIYDKIKFLLSKGYTKEEFIACPRVLIHNLDKTETRYEKFLQAGHRPSLRDLGKSEKKYSFFLHKFLDKDDKTPTKDDSLQLDLKSFS